MNNNMIKMKKFLSPLLAAAVCSVAVNAAAPARTPAAWTPSARQLENTAVEKAGPVDIAGSAGSATITVDKATEHQTIWGFGAAITGPAKDFLHDLSVANQNRVYDLLFLNTGDNLGFTIARMNIEPGMHPAPGVYDWQADAAQSRFAQEMYKRYPAPITAVPWSPPAWMKTNNSTYGGGHVKPECIDSLAQWFYDWTSYQRDKCGLNIQWLSIQNEPNAKVKWQCCDYTHAEMEAELWAAMKLFRSHGSPVMIGGPECGGDQGTQNFLDSMSKEVVASMDWIAHHGYRSVKQPQNDLDFRKYGRPVLMTELCGGPAKQSGGHADDINDGVMWSGHIQRALSRDEKGYLFWQLVRDNPGSQSLVDLKTGQDYYHPFKRAYVFANYSRFIRPGYIVVDSKSDNKDLIVTAAKHPLTGNTSVVITNKTQGDIDVTVKGLSGKAIGGRITSAQYDFAATKDISASDGDFVVRIPAMSVVSLAEK